MSGSSPKKWSDRSESRAKIEESDVLSEHLGDFAVTLSLELGLSTLKRVPSEGSKHAIAEEV